MEEKKKQHLNDLHGSLERLIRNAKVLQQFSREKFEGEAISMIQNEQETLLGHIKELSKSMGKLQSSEKKEIRKKVVQIEKYNKSFLGNLVVRHGIINKEINEISKTKKALSSIKSSYVDGKKEKRNKVNTFS